jgi:lipoprotein-releasing system permease protein
MKVAAFIAHRVAFKASGGPGGSRNSFSRFIIRLAMAATIIGVAVMIITLSFVNGFQETVRSKIFHFWGHIRIQEKQPERALIAEETPLQMNDALVEAIKKNPQVKTIQPFATRYAILKTSDDMEGVMVKGVDAGYHFHQLDQFIEEGRPPAFNDSTYSRDIMISAYTARQLKLKAGDRIFIYFIRPDGTLRPDRLTVSGIYKTGIEEYDKIYALGDIKLIRRLNDWAPDEAGGYEVFLHDYRNIDETTQVIHDLDLFPPTWDVKSMKDISPNIFDWLDLQNTTRNVLLGIMIFVAVVNLVTCLIILVLERIRMIGILKALGATDWTVQKIFLRYSSMITASGIIIGAALALGLLYLQQHTGFIRLNEEAYYISTAAVKIVWWQVLAVCGGTLLICYLVLMIPSYLVRKVQPVKAIHFR